MCFFHSVSPAPLPAILMASMNNIFFSLQVSSRSSSALPRRKLSSSRQVVCTLCVALSVPNHRYHHHKKKKKSSLSESSTGGDACIVPPPRRRNEASQSRCECKKKKKQGCKLTSVARHQHGDCVSAASIHSCPLLPLLFLLLLLPAD